MKKYTDVDIVAELQKLVDSHVDSYKEDFDIDKRIIRRAAESQNPEDKTLMWFCRPHGTHCLNENQVFIQGTRDHNTFRFYAEQTYDECIARVIVPKSVKRGKVFGDVFEINYREQAANVAQNSIAPDHDRLTFADGFVLDAPCRSSFDAAMSLVGEHGGVKTYQTLPKDADALAEVLSKQKTRRDRLPDAERTEALSPLSVAELRKYEAVKKVHPDALVCFAQNGYFELYGKDAEKAAPLLGTKLLEKKVRGKPSMPVTGFRESAWVAGSHKLWKSGADVFLSKDGETFKELKAADYIPVGATLNVDGIKCRIDAVDFAADEVRLTNIEDKNRPIRFSESIQYVRAYGYRKDPENKNHLLIDPETAPIVVQIFQWRAEGVSYMGINKKLNDAGILSPSQLKRERGVETNFNKKDRVILWNKHMITEILQNIVYIGHLAQKKGSQCLYGGIPYHITSEDEWIVAKNTHEPLLSEELFEKVQEINRAAVERTRANSGKYDHLPKAKNIYGKKFVCAECGAIMKLQRSISTKKDKVYFTFKCPTYAEHGTRGCSDVKIRKQDLDDAVFSFIKSQMEVFLDMEKTLHSLLAMKKARIKQDNTVQEIRTLRQKLAQKQSLLSGMYVDLKEGLLSDAEYSHHKEIVMEDIRAIERNLSELEAPKNQTEEQITGEMQWKQMIRRFHDATEISEEMADAFIETMKIHEDGTLEIKLSYMDEFAALTKTCEKIRKEVA